MSKKKSRFILCSNIIVAQHFNMYTNNKSIKNKYFLFKGMEFFSKEYNNYSNKESLKYSILQSNNSYLCSYKNFGIFNSCLPLYLKKYFSNIQNYKCFNNDLTKYNLNIKKPWKIFLWNKLLNKQPLQYLYKSNSKYYNRRNRIFYFEKQNENKLLNRKVNLRKIIILH